MDSMDHASSLVILEKGLRKVRLERPDLKLEDSRPIIHREVKQVVWLKQEALLKAG